MSRAILISDHDTQVPVRQLTSVGIATTPLSEEEGARIARGLTPTDFVLVYSRADGTGAKVAAGIADDTAAAVVFVGENVPAPTVEALASHGVLVVGTEAFASFPYTVLSQVSAMHTAWLAIAKENARLKNKVNETKAVGRAKCLLIENRHMTEQSAHRFIEKTAMDNRLTRRAVADSIIRNYEKHNPSDDISA